MKADTFEKAGLGEHPSYGVLWVVDAFPYLPIVGGALLASKDRRASVIGRQTRWWCSRLGRSCGADPVGRRCASNRRRDAVDHTSSPVGTTCHHPGDSIATATSGTQPATTGYDPTATHLAATSHVTGAAYLAGADRPAFRLPATSTLGVPDRARPTGVPATRRSTGIPATEDCACRPNRSSNPSRKPKPSRHPKPRRRRSSKLNRPPLPNLNPNRFPNHLRRRRPDGASATNGMTPATPTSNGIPNSPNG